MDAPPTHPCFLIQNGLGINLKLHEIKHLIIFREARGCRVWTLQLEPARRGGPDPHRMLSQAPAGVLFSSDPEINKNRISNFNLEFYTTHNTTISQPKNSNCFY